MKHIILFLLTLIAFSPSAWAGDDRHTASIGGTMIGSGAGIVLSNKKPGGGVGTYDLLITGTTTQIFITGTTTPIQITH